MWTDIGTERLPAAQRAVRAKCFHPTGTFLSFPAEACDASLPQRFEQQVRRNPTGLAIKTRHHAFTYGELDAMANRIASAILRNSDGGDEPVALLFGHGALVICAILGALKAGRPYVALDAAYPRQRLEYVLIDSTTKLILTERNHLSHARELAGENIVVIDVESIDSTSPGRNAPTGPFSPALIVYTSGSTGQPKGIVHNHRNVLHDVRQYTNSGHFCPDDRFLLVSSASFADSVRTIYSALLNGATLYPFDIQSEGLGPLGGWMVDQAITIYRSVPTVFRQFAGALTEAPEFHHLRLLYLSGEPVKRKDVDLYKRHFPATCILVNRLGTTEALTFRCNFIDHDTEFTGSLVPVGYAVPDKEVLLIDERGQAVQGEGEGEITVRSRYLSEGYWRNAELTRAAFDAAPDDPELRVFRTGDLGRFRADSSLECLGRKDFQVKIRGYRVETSEVESALLALAGIREAVVVAEHRGDQDRLIAYLVSVTRPAPDASALHRFLASRLPDYMIPSVYIALDALPLLPNGKLNRRALPEPGTTRPDLEVPFVAPRNSIEEDISRIWSEMLGLDRVGVHDNFLDLGGDSLIAMRVVSRVGDRFDVALTAAALWSASTITQMAELVAQNLPPAPGGSAQNN